MTAAGDKADKDKTGSSEEMIAIFSTSEDSPVYNISVLKALIYLLPGPPRKKSEHGPHRVAHILQYITFTCNVMDKVKEVAESLKNDLKPFVIVATTEDLPVKFYLSVYDALFEFDTFLGALDVLLQTFFVLNIPYPTQLNSFYVFMQKFFL
ncbi:hypothetical protein ACFFRR_001590 [Megaselia abdita]